MRIAHRRSLRREVGIVDVDESRLRAGIGEKEGGELRVAAPKGVLENDRRYWLAVNWGW